MGVFISIPKTVECVLTALFLSGFLCLAAFRQMGVLQSSGYGNAKYFKWLKKKGNAAFGRLAVLAALCALASAVVSLCFSFTGEWAAVISLAAFALLFVLYLVADRKTALRSNLAFTPRLCRLYAVLFLITSVVCYVFVTLLNFADNVWGNAIFGYLRYCPLAVMPVLIIPLMLLSNAVCKLYEVPLNKRFIKKAKAKLAGSDIKVIAITGSYGKTSTKFILNEILKRKYKVISTPRSHNTPIGIALAVNSHNLENYDIFIAEMGARHVGDIAELCEICPPDISLITGVCGQHMETFLSFSNIVKAKGEILNYTKDKAVIADDCFDLFAEYSCAKSRCGCVSEICATCEGVEFTLTLGGEKRRVKSKLLGEHSALNIGLAAEAAFAAGMNVDEIAEAVGGIDYIEHRLQLIKSNGVNIIDDGYNSNVKGARAAIEVLKSFGGRKIVVTPGLVELGVLEQTENYELGKSLIGLDLVILVGETIITPVKRGYEENGGNAEKLIIKPTLKDAQEQLAKFIQPEDTVLFLNDLPDIY